MPHGTQIAARLGDAEVELIDALIESGEYDSRAEVVRSAVAEFADLRRRRLIGERIVEGYRRIPETEEELRVAQDNVQALIEEEPW